MQPSSLINTNGCPNLRGALHPVLAGGAPRDARAMAKMREGVPLTAYIGAIMNKLLHIIYGVLKHQKPFDREYLKKHEKSA
jgi:hypothetical protein